MFKILFLILSCIIILFTGCAVATEDSITGEWELTHYFMVITTDDDVYYKFKDNGKYISWHDKNFPSNESLYGDYSISNGKITTESSTYDAYISGDKMYWYKNSIEVYRFTKQ